VVLCSSQKGFQVAGEVHRVGVAVLVGGGLTIEKTDDKLPEPIRLKIEELRH
jgi:hypothetical protein